MTIKQLIHRLQGLAASLPDGEDTPVMVANDGDKWGGDDTLHELDLELAQSGFPVITQGPQVAEDEWRWKVGWELPGTRATNSGTW